MRSTERNGDQDRPERPGVVRRVLAVLDTFSSADPVLGISEIARRCGLPKSTVHRIVVDLCDHRIMERVPQSAGEYRLGVRLFELGELVPVHRSLSGTALPIMEDLREATRHRVHLAVLDGIDVLYVAILGSGAVHVDSRVGGRLPAHATGVGKVLLAYAPPSVVEARIEAGLTAFTARTITSADALVAELRKIRTHGFALDIEESTPGVLCVAAPVRCRPRHSGGSVGHRHHAVDRPRHHRPGRAHGGIHLDAGPARLRSLTRPLRRTGCPGH